MVSPSIKLHDNAHERSQLVGENASSMSQALQPLGHLSRPRRSLASSVLRQGCVVVAYMIVGDRLTSDS